MINQNQKILAVDGWQVFDLPVEYSQVDYQRAREEIVNKAKITEDLIALYEFGCVPALGISDMDFWAVFVDQAEKLYIPAEPELSAKTEHLMNHMILAISEKHYRQMLLLDPWTIYAWPQGHKLLYKKPDIERDLNFKIYKFTPQEQSYLNVCAAASMLATVYTLIPFYAQKKLPVRKVFEILKDLVYITGRLNKFVEQKIETIFSEEFLNLRSNWFKLKQEEAVRRMIKVFERGMLLTFEIAFSLVGWLKDNCDYLPVTEFKLKKNKFCQNFYPKSVFISTDKEQRVCSDAIKTPQQALALSVKSYRHIKIRLIKNVKEINFYTIYQPLLMASILLGFMKIKGFLSDYLEKDTYTNLEKVPVFLPPIHQQRIELINEATRNYYNKQAENSDCKGFIFGNHRFDYQFGHESYRRKVLNHLLKYKFWSIMRQNFNTKSRIVWHNRRSFI